MTCYYSGQTQTVNSREFKFLPIIWEAAKRVVYVDFQITKNTNETTSDASCNVYTDVTYITTQFYQEHKGTAYHKTELWLDGVKQSSLSLPQNFLGAVQLRLYLKSHSLFEGQLDVVKILSNYHSTSVDRELEITNIRSSY